TFRETPMRSVLCCTLLGLTLVLGGALAAPTPDVKDKAVRAPAPADVTFADGSTMRVTLVSESVEVETKYGKLTIPAADVQRIAFAFRSPDDVAKKVKTAVQRLAENNFEEREAATKELREFGLRAYPALEEAAKSTDAEVAKRAAGLLEEIRAKVSADDLT